MILQKTGTEFEINVMIFVEAYLKSKLLLTYDINSVFAIVTLLLSNDVNVIWINTASNDEYLKKKNDIVKPIRIYERM